MERSLKKPAGYGSHHAECIGSLFAYRNKAHLMHLATKSYAEHVALNELYDSLSGSIDRFAESVQGIYGIQKISVPAVGLEGGEDPVSFCKDLYKMLNEKRNLYTEGWVQNQLDEMIEQTAVTLYKLRELK